MNKISPCKLVSLLTNNNSFTKWFIDYWHDDFNDFVKHAGNDKGCGGLVNKWCLSFLSKISKDEEIKLSEKLSNYGGWRTHQFHTYLEVIIFLSDKFEFTRINIRKNNGLYLVDVRM